MAWLEHLDTRAQTWALPNRLAYLGAKWALVAIGAIALGRMLLDRSGLWPYFP